MSKFFKTLLGAALILASAASCSYYHDDDETFEQIASGVIKSPNADFSNYHTFAVPDSIYCINGDKGERRSNPLTNSIIETVAKEFEALGYEQVTETTTEKPDLIVDMTFIETDFTGVYYDPYSYWDWYYWDWYPYYPYDPFYPYYPYPMPSYSYAYSAGNLIIEAVDMTDMNGSDDKRNTVPIVWHAVARGLYTGTHTPAEINEAIRDCFEMLPPTK